MSHIIFHKPPAMGASVKIFHKSDQRAEPLLLLTFIGDAFTTGFMIPGHKFDASKITIIINDNILPSTHWTVTEDRWLDTWTTDIDMKSVVHLNKEQAIYQLHSAIGQLYAAPFTLSMDDAGMPRDKISARISDALKAQARDYMGINFEDKKVYYTRTES